MFADQFCINNSQARTSDMERPTLRMFHKWLGYNLFYRDDIRKVRVGDLQLLYAAISKVPTLPVTLLVSHWLSIPSLQGPVGCTLAAGVREHGHVPRSGNFVPKRETGTSWNIVPKCGGTRIIYRSNHRNVSPKRLWNFVVCVHTASCPSVSGRRKI